MSTSKHDKEIKDALEKAIKKADKAASKAAKAAKKAKKAAKKAKRAEKRMNKTAKKVDKQHALTKRHLKKYDADKLKKITKKKKIQKKVREKQIGG